MIKLDKINKMILEIIQENGSITNSELSKRIGLAPASTLERVRKLEMSGVIKKYVGLVDQEQVGKGITAFVEISLSDHSARSISGFTEKISEIPEVLECYHLAGDKDFLLKVITEDIKHYREFALEKLAGMDGIGKVHTLFSLNTVKNTTAIPIE